MSRYIDAEELRKNVSPWLDGTCLVIPLSAIDDAPTVDVQPVKHGKWILNVNGSATCPLCKHTKLSAWDYDNADNYCHHCGAKMDVT